MKLQTPVADDRCLVGISYEDRIMMLGSCFSDSIGRQLADFGFDVCVNPFGTLYNPASILNSVRRLVTGVHFTEGDCVEIGAGDGRICSFCHHTSFARGTEAEFLENANVSLDAARAYFRTCTKVMITLGTSWCFRHVARDFIVSNCLKRPADEYCRELLPSHETALALTEIMRMCEEASRQDKGFVPKRFIFTVSPIRHFKDGAHGNQLSKSALLLGVDGAIKASGQTADYFPSYEIMMDELRDYRFYAEDMCHPSQQAVDYIRERFLVWALPQDEHKRLDENIRTFRRGCHIEKH
ncbi:MAG: GSCFA domain-containing protein [Bacteroidales bacterium]|nr:GSCFA domain-containing protein [Bacteroidales bacterium]